MISGSSNPYLIVTPPYTRQSAGIRVLHLLCHHLNQTGQQSFLIIYDYGKPSFDHLNPRLNTPYLTPSEIQHFKDFLILPILVQPETVRGNPFKAPCMVHYCGNYPGLLGGEKKFSTEDLVYSFSRDIAEQTLYPNNILFVPNSDTSIFNSDNNPSEKRHGSCFFASKYQSVHKGKLFSVTNGSIEITRGHNAMSAEEIAALFKTCSVFYTYENTALILEALLCGCPVVCLPNRFFTNLIGLNEVGMNGIAWGTDPGQLKKAKESLPAFKAHYDEMVDGFGRQLSSFIEGTQAFARSKQNYLAL